MKRFHNRTVIVTGGARGMSASLARGFAADGAKVVIADVLELADDGTVCAAAVGELEGKQQQLTFRLVQDHGETDAEGLIREHGAQERVKHATPWNNRLSALASLGLVVETRQGRLKRYRPLLKGV
jgi:NAD(P)-dependent dehydrogenase (short-subunit alcohol dehydrogenase family)